MVLVSLRWMIGAKSLSERRVREKKDEEREVQTINRNDT